MMMPPLRVLPFGATPWWPRNHIVRGLDDAKYIEQVGGPPGEEVSAAVNAKRSRLNVALWIVAGLLAVELLFSSAKIVVPKEKLASAGAPTRWVEDFSQRALRSIGVLELLAAVGLILPAALGIAPVLVPLAASGAVLLFVGAAITRLRRGERATILIDLTNLAMAAFVALGRFGPASFAARSVLPGRADESTRPTSTRASSTPPSADTTSTRRARMA
jgi:hypothetical protein